MVKQFLYSLLGIIFNAFVASVSIEKQTIITIDLFQIIASNFIEKVFCSTVSNFGMKTPKPFSNLQLKASKYYFLLFQEHILAPTHSFDHFHQLLVAHFRCYHLFLPSKAAQDLDHYHRSAAIFDLLIRRFYFCFTHTLFSKCGLHHQVSLRTNKRAIFNN